MNEVVIGLGSNIDPDKNIEKAISYLEDKYMLLAKSAFIQTKPVGIVDQPDFINGSVLIQTSLDQNTLDEELKKDETALGRSKSDQKFGPRKIDLDIIVFNRNIIDQDFYQRDFLKDSVLELIPDLKYEESKAE